MPGCTPNLDALKALLHYVKGNVGDQSRGALN
jgi:hypothetical protein